MRRIKVLNSEVDREWKAFDYDLNSAIGRMMNSAIEASAAKELNLIIQGDGHGKRN